MRGPLGPVTAEKYRKDVMYRETGAGPGTRTTQKMRPAPLVPHMVRRFPGAARMANPAPPSAANARLAPAGGLPGNSRPSETPAGLAQRLLYTGACPSERLLPPTPICESA